MHSIKEQCAIAVDELVEELNRLGREVIFLGDGVPVYREQILQKLKVPCSLLRLPIIVSVLPVWLLWELSTMHMAER